MTGNEKLLLEGYIYNLIKENVLFEQKKASKKSPSKSGKEKRKEVIAWLLKRSSKGHLSYKVNHAEMARKLYSPKNQDEEDAARSLFSRKLHQKKNGQGGTYQFSDEEINQLYSFKNALL